MYTLKIDAIYTGTDFSLFYTLQNPETKQINAIIPHHLPTTPKQSD